MKNDGIRYSMQKNRFASFKALFSILHQSFRLLFLTSLLYRIIAFTILTPLISGLAGALLSASGRMVIADEEIAGFFLQPFGFLTLVIVASCGLSLIALEQASLMLVLSKSKETGTMNRVWPALRHALGQFPGILGLAVRIVLRMLLYAAPFILLAILAAYALLGEHDINYYLTARPPEFYLAIISGLLLAAGLAFTLIRYAVQVIFSLPVLLFEAKSPSKALLESRLISGKRPVPIAMSIVLLIIAVITVSGLTGALFLWMGRLSTPLLLEYRELLTPVIGGLFLGFTICGFLVSIAATSSFSVLVMYWFGIMNPGVIEMPPGISEDESGKDPVETKSPVHGVVVALSALAVFFIAALTGGILLSRAEVEDRTQVAAHRAGAGSAPENTLAAVKHSIAIGADWVEIDVQRTSDNRIVVIHDRDLMRVGKSPLVITQTPYARISRVDVGSWFNPRFSDQRVPTLKSFLNQCRNRIRVIIELKYYAWDPLLADRVIEIVEDMDMEREIAIMSLKNEAVQQVKRKRPGWRVGLLATSALTDLTRANADFLALHSLMADPGMVRRVHGEDQRLFVWTINDAVGMTRMFGMGVDVIITDKPELATSLLAQRAEMDPLERMLVTSGLIVFGDQEHVAPATEGMASRDGTFSDLRKKDVNDRQ